MEKKNPSGLLVNDGSFMERFNKLQQEKEKDSKLSPTLSGISIPKTFSKIGSETKASQTSSNGKFAFKIKQKQKPKLVEAPIKLDEDEDRKRNFIPLDFESTKRQKFEQIDATNQSSKQVDAAAAAAAAPLPSDPTVKMVADKLASFVAKNGRQFEDVTRQKNPGNTPFKFLFDKSCDDYKYYVHRLIEEEKAQLQSVDPHTSQNGVASSSTLNSRSGSQISHEQHPNYQIPASALYVDTEISRASDLGEGQVSGKSVVVAKKFVEAKKASKAKKSTGVASEEYGLKGNNHRELCVHTQDFDGDIAMNKSSIFVDTEASLTSAERLETDKGTEAGINSENTHAMSIFGLNTSGGLDGPENALQANVDAELGHNNDDGIGCDVNVNSEENLNTNPPPSCQIGIEENDLEENVSEGISASNNDEGNGPAILGSNEVVVSPRESPQSAEMRIVPAAGVVREDEQAIFVRPKRVDIAGAVFPLGTMVADDVPLTDESGGTWRGFRLAAASVALIKQLEKQVPDFYDGVTYSSEKRAIQSLELLVGNLDRFFRIGLDHLSNKDLNIMRAEFEDLGRDHFRVEWAFHHIDQVLGIRASIERLNGEATGLQENLGNLQSRAAKLKAEVEDFKRKARLAEEELTSVDNQISDEERKFEVVDSSLNEQRGRLSNLNLFSESISQKNLQL